MKIALYYSEHEPPALELLAEAIIAYKQHKFKRVKEILEEVMEIVNANLEQEKEQEVVA